MISPGTADNKNGKNSKNNDKKGKVGIASPPTIAAAKQASSGSETTNCTSETSTSDAIFQSYSRQLTGVGLHRALDVNRQVKRSLQQLSRLHAKETILSEELYRLPPGSSNGMGAEAEEDAVRALQLFEQSLREYYDRCAAEAKRLREEVTLVFIVVVLSFQCKLCSFIFACRNAHLYSCFDWSWSWSWLNNLYPVYFNFVRRKIENARQRLPVRLRPLASFRRATTTRTMTMIPMPTIRQNIVPGTQLPREERR